MTEYYQKLLIVEVIALKITMGDCVACGACVSVCPCKSITIEKDENGFYMPVIDAATCVECGICQQSCPVNDRSEGISWELGTYYALWAKDGQQRFAGSSGGAFGLLADEVLAQGGVVFGAAYSDDMKFVYQTSTDDVELNKLKKSKYVESYTGDVFTKVKAALETGRKVLYCGTSCQIDGLKKYLKKDYNNLLTCDFLCHGVPAAGVYEKYINNLEERYGKPTSVDFRSKAYGWKAYCSKVTFASGKVYLKTRFQDPYLRMFFENNVLREACYSCKRLNTSNADITLGDFWRVADMDIPDTNEGISLVGVHTQAGKNAIAQLVENSDCYAKELPQTAYTYAYNRKTSKPDDRDAELEKIVKQKNLFKLSVSLETKLRGYVYWIRSIVQKVLMK